MANEDGERIMRGMAWDDPYRVRTWRELYPRADEAAVIRLIGREPED